MKTNKFRSWNDVDKCFYYFQDGKYLDENNREIDKHCFNWNNAEQFIVVKDKDKDKNKKEIYEGDIVLIGSGYGGDGYYDSVVCEVKYFEDESKFDVYNYKDKYGLVYQDYNLKDSEIIGNIHENMELLKG